MTRLTVAKLEAEVVAAINRDHANPLFLPGVPLDPAIRATAEFGEAAAAEALLLVAPAQHLRKVSASLAPHLAAGAALVIAPIFDGSGMKTKVAEALMHGKHVVGTPEAFSGYAADIVAAAAAGLAWLGTMDVGTGRSVIAPMLLIGIGSGLPLGLMDGLSVSAHCEPARQVGGDYFDYFELPDGRVGIIIADVAGKRVDLDTRLIGMHNVENLLVTLGIVGMAQLILPEFASERLVRRPSRRRHRPAGTATRPSRAGAGGGTASERARPAPCPRGCARAGRRCRGSARSGRPP